jgi:hypothetical protein
MNLSDLKSQWNQVLDEVERINRVAWLAYFDARLAKLEGGKLYLDFSDPAKLAGGHDYAKARKPELRSVVEGAIKTVTGESLEVIDA